MRTPRVWWTWLLMCPLVLAAAGDRPRDLLVQRVGGGVLKPFAAGTSASLVFFVATDCPVSNAYAPEIQRVCREYGARGVGCSLIYEDVDTSSSAGTLEQLVRTHLNDFRYDGMPAAIDRDRTIATTAKATVTPTAVLVDHAGEIRYRGRVDNLYAALGKTRQQVTSHDLRDALEAVLSGRPVTNPETESIGCFITDPALLRTHTHD